MFLLIDIMIQRARDLSVVILDVQRASGEDVFRKRKQNTQITLFSLYL